jgi:hypothetical protein
MGTANHATLGTLPDCPEVSGRAPGSNQRAATGRLAGCGRISSPLVSLLAWGGLTCFAALLPTQSSASTEVISGVSASPPFFNPSIGQREKIAFTVARTGTIQVEILDRDHFLIRKLERLAVQPGQVSVSWDGKDDSGLIVPDEAYTCRITFSGDGATDAYDPAQHFHPVSQGLTTCTYSRTEGILNYTLAWPARVHIQAGQATTDPTTRVTTGPVLKTVVDRQPRAAGVVAENWNGLDEGGTVYVPDLVHFVIGIAITPLPENVIIAVGHRGLTFFDYAQHQRPQKALAPRNLQVAQHAHHAGLTAFEDQNPPLTLGAKATYDPSTHLYQTHGARLRLTVALEPRRAMYFLTPSAELNVFVDEKLVSTQKAQRSPVQITLGPDSLPPGQHRVVLNWASGFGPVSVNAVRVDVPQAEVSQKLGKR